MWPSVPRCHYPYVVPWEGLRPSLHSSIKPTGPGLVGAVGVLTCGPEGRCPQRGAGELKKVRGFAPLALLTASHPPTPCSSSLTRSCSLRLNQGRVGFLTRQNMILAATKPPRLGSSGPLRRGALPKRPTWRYLPPANELDALALLFVGVRISQAPPCAITREALESFCPEPSLALRT